MNSISMNHLKTTKHSSSEISLEEQKEWATLKSEPDIIQTMDDGRIITMYMTEDKIFYCCRKEVTIDGYVHRQEILIDIFVLNVKKFDTPTLENQSKKEPKRFQKIIRALIKGYTGIKIGKELVSHYSEHEEQVLNKYRLLKCIFEDYLDEVLDLLEESL